MYEKPRAAPTSTPLVRHRCVRALRHSARVGPVADLCLAIVFCVLLFLPRWGIADDPGVVDEVIPPGQDELVGNMLGLGTTLPGQCAFTTGKIDHAAISGTYTCPDGQVVIELRHPSNVSGAAIRTSRFVIVVLSGAPPHDLMLALAERIRSHEAAFHWNTPSPPRPPSWFDLHRATLAWLVAIGLFALVSLRWLLPRLVRWLQATIGGLGPYMRRWQHVTRSALQRLGRGRQTCSGWAWQRMTRWGERARRFRHDPTGQLDRLVRSERFWVITIFIGSALARGWLSIVNQEANDDHLVVARMIREGGWLPPASSACMECSHAKLYHYVLAFAFDFAGSGGSRLVGNILNFIAGTVLLVVIFAFARHRRYSSPVRIMAFAFLSFNAALVGIFSQATNDGFCILFSSLAIFFLDRFLVTFRLRQVVTATIFVILAALSKASGWMIFASGATILGFTCFAAEPSLRRKYAGPSIVFVLGFLLVVPFTNPYRQNIAARHTPFVGDAFDLPLLKLEVPRPPVAWVFQDFLTFRLFDLIRVPFVDFSAPPYPLHRESLWSQLYGRMFFLRFDQGIWPNADPRLLFLGRLCLVLGLLPLVALLVGTVDQLRSIGRGAATRGVRWFAEDRDWQHLVYIGALLASLIAVVIKYYRTALLFTWMKAIYLLPAIIPFFKLFLDGLEHLWRQRPRLVTGWMLALLAASITDVIWLIHDLTIAGSPLH